MGARWPLRSLSRRCPSRGRIYPPPLGNGTVTPAISRSYHVPDYCRPRPRQRSVRLEGSRRKSLWRRRRLARGYQPGLFRKLRLLKVDEWGGLSPNSPASCEGDLRLKLLKPLRFGPVRCEGFRPDAANPRHECERITKWLADNGPIDICILGLGRN